MYNQQPHGSLALWLSGSLALWRSGLHLVTCCMGESSASGMVIFYLHSCFAQAAPRYIILAVHHQPSWSLCQDNGRGRMVLS